MKSLSVRLTYGKCIPAQALVLTGLVFTAFPVRQNAQTNPTNGALLVQDASQGVHSTISNAVHTNPEIAPEGIATMKLAPGSMVDLRVFEEADLDGTFRIDDHGDVNIPFAGPVHLESLTLHDAESAVEERLRTAEILKIAHVTININEYSMQNVVVMGEVLSPGRFPILAPRKLEDILAMAGGETQFAGNTITIHRAGQPADAAEKITYRRDKDSRAPLDVEVDPGDTVLVKRAGIVYVLGSVLRPGGYLMQEDGALDISEALALALGTSPEAATSRTRVFRKRPDGSLIEFQVDEKKVSKGEETSMQLQTEDMVYVPPSTLKSILINGSGVLSAATSAAIYTVR